MRVTRRSVIASAAAGALLPRASQAAVARAVGVTVGGTPPTTQFTTLTVVNETGSLVPAGAGYTQIGVPYKDGDCTAAEYPQFIDALTGTAQPFSIGGHTYWASGNRRFSAAVVGPFTFSLAAGASKTLQVKSGGSAPASTLAFSDIDNLAIQTNLTAAPIAGANLSGFLKAAFNSTATISPYGYTWLTGTAGLFVMRRRDFVATDAAFSTTGAAHGQLVCDGYIGALATSGGALAGGCCITRVRQPYYNFDSPVKHARAFSAIAVQRKANGGVGTTSTAIPQPTGTTYSLTSAGGGAFPTTTTTNTLYQGLAASESNNLVPVRFSSLTGTGLNTGTLYYASEWGTPTGSGTFRVFTDPHAEHEVALTSGSGTMTVLTAAIQHFGSVYTADADAEWTVFQGPGSVAAPKFLRGDINPNYWVATNIIPQYDPGLVNGTRTDIFGFSWSPVCIGPMVQNQGATGERDDIGPLTDYAVRDILTPTAGGKRLNNIIALGGAHENQGNMVEHSTNTFPVINGQVYTGPGGVGTMTGSTTLGWVQDPNAAGQKNDGSWTMPPQGEGYAAQWRDVDLSHRPNYGYWAYLRTGRPELHDLLLETGIGGLLFVYQGRNATWPTAQTCVFASDAQLRGLAWGSRDLQMAAMAVANPHPDGSGVGRMFNDMADNCATFELTNFNAMPTFCKTNNLWMKSGDGTNFFQPNVWENSYYGWAMNFAAARGHAGAKTWLSGPWIGYYNYVLTHQGAACLYVDENSLPRDTNGSTGTSTWLPTSDEHFTVYPTPGTLSWTNSGTARFTYNIDTSAQIISINGNTKFLFIAGQLPGGLSLYTPYYPTGVSGSYPTFTFNLSTTAGGGGPASLPNDNGSLGFFSLKSRFVSPTQFTAANAYDAPNSFWAGGWAGNMLGAAGWAKIQCGGTVFDALISDINSHFAFWGAANYGSNPKYRTRPV